MEIQSRIYLPLLLKHFNLPLIGCELGTAGANNSTDLLKNGLEFIYCIDSWKHMEQHGDGNFEQQWHDENYTLSLYNLAPFEGKFKLLIGKSSDVVNQIPDNTLGLLYIDADHSYSACKTDIENYYCKLVKGGIISCHDYYNEGYGVKQAVDEFCDFKNLKLNKIPEYNMDDNCASVWVQI